MPPGFSSSTLMAVRLVTTRRVRLRTRCSPRRRREIDPRALRRHSLPGTHVLLGRGAPRPKYSCSACGGLHKMLEASTVIKWQELSFCSATGCHGRFTLSLCWDEGLAPLPFVVHSLYMRNQALAPTGYTISGVSTAPERPMPARRSRASNNLRYPHHADASAAYAFELLDPITA